MRDILFTMNPLKKCTSCGYVPNPDDRLFVIDVPSSQPQVSFCSPCLAATVKEYLMLEEEGFA